MQKEAIGSLKAGESSRENQTLKHREHFRLAGFLQPSQTWGLDIGPLP
jgi:hypothetical protein